MKLSLLVIFGLLVCSYSLLPATSESSQGFDIVITNGHIIDGTGSPWYSGDLGIWDGKIVAIGNLAAAPRKRTIDARGMVVAPGFIDMLGQSELTILVDPRLPSKIFQGITTEITGEGGSAAPLNDAMIQADRSSYEHLANLAPVFRASRKTGHGNQSRNLHRGDAGPSHGAWGCGPATNGAATGADESSGA